MNCPNCGASIRAGAGRCIKCGSVVDVPPPQQAAPSAPVYVVQQPQPIVQQQGRYLAQTPVVEMTPVKNRIVAGILGILLGALGVHNFYLGNIGKGLAQLLISLCTCGYGAIASGIWGLIEGILILTGTINTDGKGRPLVG